MEIKIVAKKENYLILCVKCTIFLSECRKFWVFSIYFNVSLQKKLQEICTVGDELKHANRQTEKKKTGVLFNYVNAHIKNLCSRQSNFKREDFGGGRTRGVLKQQYISWPANSYIWKYLHMPMACNFVTDITEYI